MAAVFPESWRGLRVALCHDWLTGMRGGERVLEILCEAFPDAPIYTLLHNRRAISPAINCHPIQASFLQHVPGIAAHYRYFLPFFPAAIRSFRPPRADLVISTSHCVAKGLPVAPGTPHLCYCFTPMRYAWCFQEEYFGRSGPRRALVGPLLAWLRRWDRRTSARVTRFVAISEHVRQRIRRAYERDADIVFPPVDLERCTPLPRAVNGDFDLVVSALVPYKRVDIAVRAYSRAGWPLRVVGAGTELERLRAIAGPSVEVLGWLPDDKVLELYRACRFLVFPGEEDFGIVPLEAQACGKPVIAFRKGGVLETVAEAVSGVFFDSQNEAALLDAVGRAAAMPWDPAAIRRHAEAFGVQRFADGMRRAIDACAAGRAGPATAPRDP